MLHFHYRAFVIAVTLTCLFVLTASIGPVFEAGRLMEHG